MIVINDSSINLLKEHQCLKYRTFLPHLFNFKFKVFQNIFWHLVPFYSWYPSGLLEPAHLGLWWSSFTAPWIAASVFSMHLLIALHLSPPSSSFLGTNSVRANDQTHSSHKQGQKVSRFQENGQTLEAVMQVALKLIPQNKISRCGWQT